MATTLADGAQVAEMGEPAGPPACRRSPDDDCSPYHGFWPMLRRLGLAATPDRHAAFFERTIGAAAAAGARHVLIAGLADSAMLEVVLRAWGPATPLGANRTLRLWVVDRCRTPLRAAEAYADRLGLALRTAVIDLSRAAPPGAFDLICSHSLLTAVAPGARPLVVRHLWSALRPGGAFTTVARIGGDEPMAGDRVAPFLERVRAAAAERGVPCDATLLGAAERYARWTRVEPVASIDRLAALFHGAGFTLAECATVARGGVAGCTVGGSARMATYAEVVARRA